MMKSLLVVVVFRSQFKSIVRKILLMNLLIHSPIHPKNIDEMAKSKGEQIKNMILFMSFL